MAKNIALAALISSPVESLQARRACQKAVKRLNKAVKGKARK